MSYGFEFDPERAAQVSDNDVLPPGEYIAMIANVEDKETKSGTGAYIKLELHIQQAQDPTYIGWKVFDNINYRNENPKAEEIAWRTLKKLARAIYGDENTRFGVQELVAKRVKIKTTIEEQGTYRNTRVSMYSDSSEGLGKNAPQAYRPQPAQQYQQQPQQQRQQPPPNANNVYPPAQQQRPPQQQQQRPQPQQQQRQQYQQPPQDRWQPTEDVPF